MLAVSTVASVAAWADYEDPPFPLAPCFVPVYVFQALLLLVALAAIVTSCLNMDQQEARWLGLGAFDFVLAIFAGMATLILISLKASGRFSLPWVVAVAPVSVGVVMVAIPMACIASLPLLMRETNNSHSKWRGFYSMRMPVRAKALQALSHALAPTPEMAAIAVTRDTWQQRASNQNPEFAMGDFQRVGDVATPSMLSEPNAGQVQDEMMVLSDGSMRCLRVVGLLPKELPLSAAKRAGSDGRQAIVASVGAASEADAAVAVYGPQGRGLQDPFGLDLVEKGLGR